MYNVFLAFAASLIESANYNADTVVTLNNISDSCTVVERRSLTGELLLSCARPAADG